MAETSLNPDANTTGQHVLGEWMTQAELADELRVSVDTLQRWHNQRVGPPRAKIGSRVMYRREAVREWLRSREEKSPLGAAR